MIEFLQDYVTKALPPESFTDGEQVTRSPESELYFVRLGVAGYVIDGKLVDQDYQPIVRKVIAVIETVDRRFADTGRGGEIIGLDAPQRASSGPGNDVVFSGQPDGTTLGSLEFEQLRGDLAASSSQFAEFRTTSESEIERLKGLLDAGTEAFRTADSAFAQEREKLTGERDQALADLGELRPQLDTATSRVAELEGLLAEATKPAEDGASANKAAKAK